MLTETQQALEAHFSALAAARKPVGLPVYALEHGLTPEEIAFLRSAASLSLKTQDPKDQHWLVWVVLATEVGYSYAGDEYWPALEDRPRDWSDNHRRTWLRRRFERFQARFGGPKPVGRWAHHFINIAWPITNAILPRYLQSLFAAQLHAKRWLVADRAMLAHEGLGEILLHDYDGASSRLADFLQQTELTTQIVRALRDCDLGVSLPRISPDVLDRIVHDLERRSETRALFREARTVLTTHRSTVAPSLRTARDETSAPSGTSSTIAGLALAGRRLPNGSIALGAIFPDIPALLSHLGIARQVLSSARITSSDTPERAEPALALIDLARCDRAISRFPDRDESLLTLETSDVALRAAIQPMFIVGGGPTWLLKRNSDGLYRELRARQVRTGDSYIVLTRSRIDPLLEQQAGLTPTASATGNIETYLLEMPKLLTPEQRVALHTLGIGTIGGLRVEPIGLSPACVQESGRPAWTVSEPVQLMIQADYAVPGFSLCLDDAAAEQIAAKASKVLVRLPALHIGAHRLSIQVITHAASSSSEQGGTATFDFDILEPTPWPEAMRSRAGFRLLLEPADADIEALLSGRAAARLFGPVERSATWTLQTADGSGHIVASREGGQSPANAICPKGVLDRLRTQLSDDIDAAHRVDLIATIGELGRQMLSFPHKVEAIRWRYSPTDHRLRLIDESSHDQPVSVRLYPLATPLRRRLVPYEEAIAGLVIEAPGALLIADHDRRSFGIFASVPPADRLRALADLAIDQDLRLERTDREATLILLASLARWRRAKPVGRQAIMRKDMTLARIIDHLADRACGRDFMDLVRRDDTAGLVRAQSMVGGSPGFGLRMRTIVPIDFESALLTFANAARLYAVETNDDTIADALRLAFAPSTFRLETLDSARRRVAAVIENRILLRGAYLAASAARLHALAPQAIAS